MSDKHEARLRAAMKTVDARRDLDCGTAILILAFPGNAPEQALLAARGCSEDEAIAALEAILVRLNGDALRRHVRDAAESWRRGAPAEVEG